MNKNFSLLLSAINKPSEPRSRRERGATIFKSHYYIVIDMSYDQISDEAIVATIRRKGYKATPQRIAICRVALRSHDHPNAQQIYDLVQKEHPTVSLATVYKTLQMLQELDLVREICLTKDETRYDPLLAPHFNLICTRCGIIQDLEDPAIQKIVEKIALATSFIMTELPVSVFGICSKCQVIKN